ncbi:MAG: hypothetical protein H0W12_02545 [Chitinophagaceae bacterium]|nr:hypothetical protein [Chitinophagaceae bacterium]
MKKILFGIIAFTAVSLTACAQSHNGQDQTQTNSSMNRDRSGNRHGGHDGMMKDLNLTDAQKQQASAINADFKSKMDDLNKHDNMSVKDFRTQKENLENNKKARFEAILSPDQKSKFAEIKNNRGGRDGMMANRGDDKDGMRDRNGMGNHGDRGNRMGNGNIEKMQSDLGLNNDQVSRMKADGESFKMKADAIKSNTSLSDDQKKSQFMQLRKEREQSFKSYLTPDQIKKMDEMKAKRWKDSKNQRDIKTT